MRIKSALLLGSLAILITAIVFALFRVNTPEDPVPAQPVEATVLQPFVERRIILFMGPMKPVNVDFETKTFDSPVSIVDPDGGLTVLYYQPEDFSLNVAGQRISGLKIDRSKNQEWISLRPIDSPVEISIAGKSLNLAQDDVVMFNLYGQDPLPSIVMEIWRDGLFNKKNMNVFFEESSNEPVQRIPNWIRDILNT